MCPFPMQRSDAHNMHASTSGCCDAVVDKLHLYGDVCVVDDRVYYDLFASVHVVIIGDLHL